MALIRMMSIVIPAWNEEKLLAKCLASLRKQNYFGAYEIIVVDNGSDDATAQIAEAFGVRVVTCIRHGVLYARQTGADVAKGDILVQADADTEYPRDWLAKLEAQFRSHPEVVAVGGAFAYKDAPFWAWLEYGVRSFVNVTTQHFLGSPFLVSGANFAFRKKAFLTVGGYRYDAISGDQYDLAKRLSAIGDVVFDRHSRVWTSPRRVQRTPPILFWYTMNNLVRSFRYLVVLPGFSAARKGTSILFRGGVLKLVPVFALVIFFAYGYFFPNAQVFGKVYYKANPSEKIIALTFDDGPNEPYTSQVLDVLHAHHVQATFFLIGANVLKYPDTVKKIIENGDIVGNHTFSHDANHALTDQGCKDLERAEQVIVSIAGVRPHLYRPPHGKKTPWELRCVRKNNLAEIEWSDETNELHTYLLRGKPTADAVAQEIIEQARPGDVILLHDGYGAFHNTPQADKSLTVEALPLVIEGLQQEGYRFVTVPELFHIPAYNR